MLDSFVEKAWCSVLLFPANMTHSSIIYCSEDATSRAIGTRGTHTERRLYFEFALQTQVSTCCLRPYFVVSGPYSTMGAITLKGRKLYLLMKIICGTSFMMQAQNPPSHLNTPLTITN